MSPPRGESATRNNAGRPPLTCGFWGSALPVDSHRLAFSRGFFADYLSDPLHGNLLVHLAIPQALRNNLLLDGQEGAIREVLRARRNHDRANVGTGDDVGVLLSVLSWER